MGPRVCCNMSCTSSRDRRPQAASESPHESPERPRACTCRASGRQPYRVGSWLGGVIHEIVREELLEHVEVPSALNLLGITAHHGFRRVRYGVTSHRMSPLRIGS